MGIRKAALFLSAALFLALSPIDAMAQTQNPGPPPQAQTTPVITPPQQDVVREQPVAVLDRARPEYDPPGRRLGGFELNASLNLDATSTDNLFAATDAFEEDDIVYEVTPTARLVSGWSRHALAFEGSYTSTTHADFDSEDAETYYVRGNGRLDIGDASSVSAAARAAHQVTPRTDPDAPSFLNPPTEYDRYDVTVGAQHRFARVLVRGDVDWIEYDYEGAQDFRDNEESRIRGRAEIDITPRLDLLLQASADEFEYTNQPNLDSEGQTYLVGVALDGDLVTGEISAGYFERDYEDPNVDTFDGLAVAAAVEWYITRLTTITFTGRQDADDQIGASAQPFVTTELGLRVDHELLRNLILSLAGLAGERDYEDFDRNDEYTEFEFGADWLLNPHAVVRLRYEYDDVESDGTQARPEFDVNAVTLGLSLRL
ncbi:MAG: outer membrane beta-barrel protein [Vitreimonas sp.]